MFFHPIVKVSVCVISYNQKLFLKECLDSLLSQVCDFDYEIIVGDDASSDGSKELIEDYHNRYPEIIVPVLHFKNIGPTANYFSVHNKARGLFVCHMDGDDLAFPWKLKEQVEFMEANPDVNLLWHRMNFFNSNGASVDHPQVSSGFVGVKIYRNDLILYGAFGAHSSLMYRKSVYSNRYEGRDILDWLQSVELIGDGAAYLLPQVLGRYRISSSGVSRGQSGGNKVRLLIRSAQVEMLERFSDSASIVSLRALFMTGMDFMAFRKSFVYSLDVLLKSRSVPSFKLAGKLISHYRATKMPREFR